LEDDMTIIQKSLAKVLFKNLASFVCICALFVLTGVSCQQASPSVPHSRGAALAKGAIKDPIEIKDQDELKAIEDDPAGDYILTASFPLTNWTPICDPDTGVDPFTGNLDGDGFTITVNSFDGTALSGSQYIGIFATSDASAEFFDLTVGFATGNLSAPAARHVGGLVAYAEGTTFTDITVSGSFDVTTSITAPGLPVRPDLSRLPFADSFHALIPGADKTSGLNIGGVAGYSGATSSFSGINAGANITATSRNTAAFVGGVVGFSDDSSITSSHNTENITANGPGYNTSAGGIAGYIVHTTVDQSSSSGVIAGSASGGTGWNDSWQVDVGGLVGYSGGSDAGSSSITKSSATGTVSAVGPFPYAGGLLGYNYGDNNFSTNAQAHGSLVSRSYASSYVTAQSVSSGNTYGNIPYAGGLAGYSSIVGSLIEDSYATGPAIVLTPGTYAWAGGLVGGNANDSVVNRTYATGSVSSTVGSLAPLFAPTNALNGPAAGGIAGFNYYTTATTTSNSIALNELLDTNNTTPNPPVDVVRRVVGSWGIAAPLGTLTNNLAYDTMTVNTYVPSGPNPGLTLRDGSSSVAQPPQSVYEKDLGWDFANVWQPFSSGYPKLR
jgi:hypothetical protein